VIEISKAFFLFVLFFTFLNKQFSLLFYMCNLHINCIYTHNCIYVCNLKFIHYFFHFTPKNSV
jgi:hypothetical protein